MDSFYETELEIWASWAICIEFMNIFKLFTIVFAIIIALAANGVLGLSPGRRTVMTSVGHEATNSFIERLYSDNLID